MDDVSPCEVNGSFFEEPAVVIPGPVGDGGVDDDVEGNGEGDEEGNANSADDGADEDGGRDGCEHGLEEEESCERDSGWVSSL